MFAVPGWAVSASSLVQEKLRSKNARTKSDSTSTKQSKKRKRSENILDPDSSGVDHDDQNSRQNRDSKLANATALADSVQDTKVGKDQTQRHNSTGEHVRVEPKIIDRPGASTTSSDKHRTSKIKDKRPGRVDKASEQTHATGNKDSHGGKKVDRVPVSAPPMPTAQLTPLQAKMRSKLTSARFRHLNETLYTTSSSEALNLFTSSPDLFAEYHAGFAQQVKESWPQNPVEEYIRSVKMRGGSVEPKQGISPLPRRKTGSCTIADLGCGDAPLARGCQAVIKTLNLKFHNYDLHAVNTLITKADISNLPLRDGEADIAVFCLSLMGTNWINFVEEAWRILRGDGKGEVWVAEVKSRFGRVTKGRVVENSVGKRRKRPKTKTNGDADDYDGPEQFAEDERKANEPEDETDISAFVKVFTRRGFQLREGSVNKRNKMFVSMVFTKSGIPTAGKHKGLKWTGKEYQKQHDGKMKFANSHKDEDEVTPEQVAMVLKPCVYKTR